MADHVVPTPLEVFGSYVAYPLAKQSTRVDDTLVVDLAAALNGNDPPGGKRQSISRGDERSRSTEVLERLPLASAKSERLITLPTRGVFAEGKFGHCNVSEEIDNTRFLEMGGASIPMRRRASIPSPLYSRNPNRSPRPQRPSRNRSSISSIQRPRPIRPASRRPPLLGTPNIFRDMSGRQEVADLLKKLSDNTIAIAEAANRRGRSRANTAAIWKGIGAVRRTPTPAPQQPAPPPTKQQQQRAELENDEKILEAADKHLPPEPKKQVKNVVVKKWTQPKKAWTVSLSSEWPAKPSSSR